MSAYEWSIVAFVVFVAFVCVFMLTVPLLLGGKSWGRAKQEQFESGVVGAGGARIRFSAKFYLVAIFFVVFDLEVLYLYSWATVVREVGWVGFIAAALFIGILLLGLVYELATGGLIWSPSDRAKASGLGQALSAKPSAQLNLATITRFNNIEELVVDPTGKIPAQSRIKTPPSVQNDAKEQGK